MRTSSSHGELSSGSALGGSDHQQQNPHHHRCNSRKRKPQRARFDGDAPPSPLSPAALQALVAAPVQQSRNREYCF